MTEAFAVITAALASRQVGLYLNIVFVLCVCVCCIDNHDSGYLGMAVQLYE